MIVLVLLIRIIGGKLSLLLSAIKRDLPSVSYLWSEVNEFYLSILRSTFPLTFSFCGVLMF